MKGITIRRMLGFWKTALVTHQIIIELNLMKLEYIILYNISILQ
jgi:hypothetical protein